jgi:hypothetical protein
MNKFLRYSFVALLAMVVGNVMAQDVTLDFTLETEEGSKQSVWGFPASSKNKQVEEQSFTYNGYTVKVAGSEGNGYYWHDKDHYLLFGKQGAYVTLPAFDFDVQRIEVVGTSGASTGVKQNIFVGDEAICTETTGAKNVTNSYDIPEGKQAAGTIYTIKVTSSHNDQISKIYIYKKGATVIDEPEFSVPAGTYTEPQTVAMTCATEGAKILYTIPAGQDPEYIDDENVTGVWYDGTPLEITRTTTIKAMAVKDGKTSNIVTATYTISTISGQGTLENPYTVADAITVTSQLEKGQKSEQDYYIKGKISEIKYTFSAQYGTATFFISDDGNTENQFQIYGAYYLENKAWVEGNTQIAVGDDVIIYGKVMNYNGTLETSNKEAYIYSLNGVTKNESGEEPEPQPENQDINVAKALEVINALENGATTSVEYKVTGYVVTVTEISTKYGNATFTIADQANGTDVLTIFRAKDANGNNITNENLLKAGDLVVVQGKLQKYVKNDNITPELTGGKILTVNGVDTGISNVTTAKMVNGARYNLAGQRVNAGYKGVVIMNGQKMLVK